MMVRISKKQREAAEKAERDRRADDQYAEYRDKMEIENDVYSLGKESADYILGSIEANMNSLELDTLTWVKEEMQNEFPDLCLNWDDDKLAAAIDIAITRKNKIAKKGKA